MTIKELKEAIKDLPDTMDVFLDTTPACEYENELLERAYVATISFKDDDLSAEDEVLVLSWAL